jgi:hypothetical protein
MKKLTLLLTFAALCVAALPAAASAKNWNDAGIALQAGQNPHVLFEGTFQVVGELGVIHCAEGTSTVQLTGGSAVASVSTFSADNLSTKCDVEGLLKEVCGTRSLSNLTLTKAATMTANETGKLSITGISLRATFGVCATVDFTGELTATPDNRNLIGFITLAGNLTDNVTEENNAVSGTLKATPATYGF